MQWMYNMKIGAKLLVSFIIVALLTGVVGVVGFVNVQKLEDSNTLLYEKMTLPIAEVGQISTSYQQMRVIVRDMVIENDPALIQANADQVGVHNQEIDEAAAAFEETLIDSEMQAVFEAFMASRKALAQEFEQLKALALENKDSEALALLADEGAYEKAAAVEMDAINKLVPMKLDEAQVFAELDRAAASAAKNTMVMVTLISFAVAIVFGLVLRYLISKPLQQATQMSKEMNMGHFTMRLKMKRKDVDWRNGRSHRLLLGCHPERCDWNHESACQRRCQCRH